MEFLTNRYVQAAIAGFLTAIAVDFQAFRSFKSLDEYAAYDWKVALFRWAQGVLFGVLTAFGVGSAT